MVEFINKHTGQKMFVHETRVREYLAMGHTISPSSNSIIDVEFEEHEEKPVEEKKAKRKTSTRKKKVG